MRVLKESFNAGEFTPRLQSRSEIAKYKNGCKTLTNMVPLAHGPVTRRPGTEYIAAVKTASEHTRLIPFEFSEVDSYVIELGDLYCRFYRNGGQVLTADANTLLLLHCDDKNLSQTFVDDGATGHSPTAVADACQKTAEKRFGSSSAYFDGTADYVSVPDHNDFTPAAANFTVDFWVRFDTVGSNERGLFTHATDTSNFYSMYYDGDGKVLYFTVRTTGTDEVELTYTWTPVVDQWYHIAVIRGWAGNAHDWAICIDGAAVETDTVNYTVPNYATAVFRVGSAIGSVAAVFHKGYIDEFRYSDTARWTATFAPPTSQYPYADSSGTVYEVVTTYVTADIPQLQFVQSADTMYIVHANYVVRKLVRTSHASWAISDVSFTNAPADWSAADYPRTIEFYEDRLCFGGSPDQPDTFWTSDTGDYTVFTGTAGDDEAITHTLGARKINDIQWITAGRRLLLGTRGEEWWASGSSDTEPITPSAKVSRRDSTWGSEAIMPVNIGEVVFYVQRSGRSIREMVYDFGRDKYISTDLNVLAEHLTRNYKISAMAYQQFPYQILWCVREDGTLLALTYLKEHDVIGWSTHTSGAGGEFESVSVIPGAGGQEDEVWFVVKRTINSATVRNVEKLKPFNYGASLEDAFFVDSGITYDGAAATAISGLSHLEGEAVAVNADGVNITGHTVASGAITLASAASKVHVGLAYTPVVETLDVEVEDDDGLLTGIIRRITNVSIKLIDSQGGQVGHRSSTLDDIPYSDTTALYTGWTDDLTFDEGYDKASNVYITSDKPFPLEVAAINIDLED